MISELKYIPLSQVGWYLLTEDLHYTTCILDIHAISPSYAKDLAKKTGMGIKEPFTITVPKGFLTDLASVPKLFHGITPPDGPWEAAAVVHDFLYQLRPRGIDEVDSNSPHSLMESYLSRFVCDRIFYLAMRDSGVSTGVAGTFFNVVRAGGGHFFQKPTDAPKLTTPTLYRPATPYKVIRPHAQYPAVPKDLFEIPNSKEWAALHYVNHGRPLYFNHLNKET